jgi:hypothetical protein
MISVLFSFRHPNILLKKGMKLLFLTLVLQSDKQELARQLIKSYKADEKA